MCAPRQKQTAVDHSRWQKVALDHIQSQKVTLTLTENMIGSISIEFWKIFKANGKVVQYQYPWPPREEQFSTCFPITSTRRPGAHRPPLQCILAQTRKAEQCCHFVIWWDSPLIGAAAWLFFQLLHVCNLVLNKMWCKICCAFETVICAVVHYIRSFNPCRQCKGSPLYYIFQPLCIRICILYLYLYFVFVFVPPCSGIYFNHALICSCSTLLLLDVHLSNL